MRVPERGAGQFRTPISHRAIEEKSVPRFHDFNVRLESEDRLILCPVRGDRMRNANRYGWCWWRGRPEIVDGRVVHDAPADSNSVRRTYLDSRCRWLSIVLTIAPFWLALLARCGRFFRW